MSTQHFFIEGKYLGQATRTFNLVTGQPALSYGFFCQNCGRVFATAAIEGRQWQYWSRTCSRCPGGGTLGNPGSLWLAWDPDFVEAFPEPVLRYEFERLLEHFDRTQNGQ